MKTTILALTLMTIFNANSNELPKKLSNLKISCELVSAYELWNDNDLRINFKPTTKQLIKMEGKVSIDPIRGGELYSICTDVAINDQGEMSQISCITLDDENIKEFSDKKIKIAEKDTFFSNNWGTIVINKKDNSGRFTEHASWRDDLGSHGGSVNAEVIFKNCIIEE